MKISVVGSGKVGAAIAFTVMLRGLAREIVMVDVNRQKADGEALDMLQCQAFASPTHIKGGDLTDTAGSDVVVITAGVPRRADEPRVLLLSRNATVVGELVRQVVRYSPEAILFMVTNPLDVMTQLAYELSGFPASRVFGMGTALDTARYRSYLGAAYGVDARDITAYVVGEHGETMVPLTSHITVRGIPLHALPLYSAAKLDQIVQDVINASSQVIALKGGTVFAPAVTAATIIAAIASDAQAVVPVCNYQPEYGVALSLPAVISRDGAKTLPSLPMSAEEQAKLRASAANIQQYVQEMKQSMR